MQIKQDVVLGVKHARHKRVHLQRKLDRAARAAGELEALCTTCADAKTALEARAYAAWMEGIRQMEASRGGSWERAAAAFDAARKAYEELGREDGPDQSLFYEAMDELEPRMRFCRHQLQRAGGAGADRLSGSGGQPRGGGTDGEAPASGGARFSWRGHEYEVTDARASRHFAAALETLRGVAGEPSSSEEDLRLYSQALAALNDAKRALAEALMTLSSYAEAPDASRRQALQGLEQAIGGFLIERTVDRCLCLILLHRAQFQGVMRRAVSGESNAPERVRAAQELARHLEMLQECYFELADLGGQMDSTGGEALVEDCRAQVVTVKGWRCYFLAHSFFAGGQYAEGCVLFQRAADHAAARADAMSASDVPGALDAAGMDAGSLADLADSYNAVAHAKALASDSAGERGAVSNQLEGLGLASGGVSARGAAPEAQKRGAAYLTDHLGEFRSFAGGKGHPSRIFQLQPALQEISHPPIFLDAVLERLEYPDLSARVGRKKKAQARAAEAPVDGAETPASVVGNVVGGAAKLFGWGR